MGLRGAETRPSGDWLEERTVCLSGGAKVPDSAAHLAMQCPIAGKFWRADDALVIAGDFSIGRDTEDLRSIGLGEGDGISAIVQAE